MLGNINIMQSLKFFFFFVRSQILPGPDGIHLRCQGPVMRH